MGVAGLWEVLRPAGQVRSLTELAVEDGFNANPNHQRGFRIGIDASIWFFHAAYGKEGENPELRTLFFRCCRLLQLPLLPLFVFDGPHRPAVKRGKRVGGNVHWLTQGMRNIIDAFGFEWRIAPGEAEAELAYLNRIGIIDAVLSDDVDNFLFGATMVIRNPSNTLSGNRAHPVKNAQGKDDGNHVVAYTSHAILSDPSVALSRAGTVLIGLLSGGDYIPAGLPGCGQKFATGLARAGFGDSLMKGVKELKGPRLNAFLDQWRQDLRNELKTNKSGLLPSKKPSLAASLPDDFPSLPVLMSYADPITSENTPHKGNHKSTSGMWRNDPDPMRIASLCELYFEWGVKDVIVHRFRTALWPGVICRAVRRVIIDEDARQRPPEEEDERCLSSPTKKISSGLSTLQLSSPSKKSQIPTSNSSSSTSESFALSSLIRLTSPASPGSSRSASPSSPISSTSGQSALLLEVLSQRTHVSTDSTLEYRVLVNPTPLVERAESGVKGLRPPLVGGLFGVDSEDENKDHEPDESGEDGDGEDGIGRLETAACAASKSGTKKRKAHRKDPMTPLRVWLPACMIRAAAPALAKAYEEKAKAREEKKSKRGTRGGRGGRVAMGVGTTEKKTKTKGTEVTDDDDGESVPGPSTPKKAVGRKVKTKVVGVGGRRRKPKQASEAQDEAYEYIDLSGGESPCSPEEESVEENVKRKGKAKKGQNYSTKPKTKASAKISVTNTKATTSTMNEFFNPAQRSAVRPTKSKPSTYRPPATKRSAPGPPTSKRIYATEEEDIPPLLPQSSHPLDLLRPKSKSSAPAEVTSKSKSSVPRYEEDESSSSSSHPGQSEAALGLTRHPARPALPAKKPSYIELSDTDSEIVASDFRGPLARATMTIAAREEVCDNSVKVGAGKASSAFDFQKRPRRVVEGAIDLIARESEKKTKNAASMLIPTDPPSQEHVLSAPLGTGPTRSSSKLAHILLPPSGLESEEEKGSEEDELPTFHCGSTKSKTKKTKVMVGQPAPFPMQLVAESSVSSRTSRFAERSGGRCNDECDYDDAVEIVDVFTTPRGPSPPRSPTPTPSPANPLLVQPSAGLATFGEAKRSKRFPASPMQSSSLAGANPRENTKLRHRGSVDRDAHTTENEGDELCKSPRRSAVHSSPRRVPHDRAASPTSMRTSSLRNHTLWADGAEERDVASDNCQPQPEAPRFPRIAGQKPRFSDVSTISISSDSGDGDDAGLVVDDNQGGIEAEVGEENLDDCVEEDVNEWADRGMILSMPPSPARTALSRVADLVSVGASAKDVLADPNPARTSKFKPAALASSKADVQASSVEFLASAKTRSNAENKKSAGNAVATSLPMHRAPLLIARSKSSKGRDEDVIDLTSD